MCIYKVKNNSGITDEWLANEIAPAITQAFGPAVGAILARPLLWACFDAATVELVSPDILNSVNAKFIRLESGLLDGVNPIDRVEVLPSESGGTVSLDEMPEEGGGDPMDRMAKGTRSFDRILSGAPLFLRR